MSTVRAPYPSAMDAIDGLSIISIERTATDVTFRNRLGAAVGTFTIRNADSAKYALAIRSIAPFDSDAREVLVKDWTRPLADNTKLANPATPPASVAFDVSWSPDSTYLAVAHSLSPYLTVYKKSSADVLTKLADPSLLPAGGGLGAAWSNDGQYLAITHDSSSPYLAIYKRSGDVLTKLANPATVPTGKAWGVAWSLDGTYLAIAHDTAPFMTVYKRSGDVFTKIADPATIPPTATALPNGRRGAAWSSGATYLVITHPGAPYVSIYKRSGDTLTKLSDPAVLPSAVAYNCTFSPDSTYLAIALSVSPYVMIYKRNGDVFTKLADPAVLPTGAAYGVSWTPDGRYLAVGHNGGSTIPCNIYRRNGDVFTLTDYPSTLPVNNGNEIAFSLDGKYLAYVIGSSPYIACYKSIMGPVAGAAIRVPLGP